MGSGQQRSGTFTVTSLDLTKAVIFADPLPSEIYQVFLQPQSSISVAFWPSGLTAAGFTANLSVGVNATFSYLAITTL